MLPCRLASFHAALAFVLGAHLLALSPGDAQAAVTPTDTTNIALTNARTETGGNATENPDVTGGAGGAVVAYTESGSFTCCGGSFLGDNLDDGDVGLGIGSDGLYAIPDAGTLTLDFGSSQTIGSIAIYNGYTNRDDGTYTLRDDGTNVLGAWTIATGTGSSSNDGADSIWIHFPTPVTTSLLTLEATSTEGTLTPSYREIVVMAPALPECDDGLDNDGDGDTDTLDADCVDAADPVEGVGVVGVTKLSETSGELSGVGNPGGLLAAVDLFGQGVAGLGDFDDDGAADVIVGARGDDNPVSSSGAAYALLLNTDGTVKAQQKIGDGVGGFFPAGGLSGDSFSDKLAHLGDVDGDGIDDVAAGVFLDDDGGGSGFGSVYVLFLNADRTVKSHQKISATQGGFTGPLENGDQMTAGAGLGDLNGDGIPDMVVGAARDDDGGTDRGALYILFLNRDGTVKAERKVSQTQGGFGGTLADGDRFGAGFARLGDLDGDKVTELAVWAPRDNGAGGTWRGAVWILFLRANGTVKDQVKIGDGVGGFPGGVLADADVFGLPTAPGDLDGDGVADLVVSSFLDDGAGFDRGALWLLFLNADGTVKASPPPRRITEGFSGMPAGLFDDVDYFGADPAAVGDVDGDGVTDLVVGASLDDDGTGADHGAAYVLFLDAEPAVCGNGVLDPLEECDDGANVSGDECSASCERENWLVITGTASGLDDVDVTVDGHLVVESPSVGQTAGQVLLALAASIEAADPDLEAVVSGDVLYTNGSITQFDGSNSGLSVSQHVIEDLVYRQTLSFELSRYAPVALSVSGTGVAPLRRTPSGRLDRIFFLTGIAGTDSSPVVEPNTLLDPAELSLSASLSHSVDTAVWNPPLGPRLPGAFPSGTLRVCFLLPCPTGAFIPLPLSGVGLTTTTTFVTPIQTNETVQQAFGPWTASKVTLSSAITPTVTAAGFAHGPLSNSVTLALTGGVLQMVSPTQVTTSFAGISSMALVNRWTLEFLPEPTTGLSFGAGAVLVALLGRRRMRR
jgi:cysteine-rich repeat protein